MSKGILRIKIGGCGVEGVHGEKRGTTVNKNKVGKKTSAQKNKIQYAERRRVTISMQNQVGMIERGPVVSNQVGANTCSGLG